MWASISTSKAFIWSTISVTIVGKGEVVPQACHSCNVMDPLTGSLGGEREAEVDMGLRRKRIVVGLWCIMWKWKWKWKWVFILNARDEERKYLNANVKALVLVVLVVEAMMSMVCCPSLWHLCLFDCDFVSCTNCKGIVVVCLFQKRQHIVRF